MHDGSTTQASTTETVQNQQQTTDDINGEERVDDDNVSVDERSHEEAQLDLGYHCEYEATVHQPEFTFYMETNDGQVEEKYDEKPQAEVEEFVEETRADTVDMVDEEQQQETSQYMPTDDGQCEEKNDEKPQAEIEEFVRRDLPAKASFLESSQTGKMEQHNTKNQSRKRKSDVIEDSQLEHSTKKLRKSARLQEKRLAKEKKD